jgi:type II secretory pathway pseudopilin PulG
MAALGSGRPRSDNACHSNMMVSQQTKQIRGRSLAGITIIEVVMSLAIMGISFGAIVMGYVMSARRAEWSAYSLAANSLAMQRLEQCRAAKWDLLTTPITDELVASNFVAQASILDVPISGENITSATNFTTITLISANPPLKMVRVDCVWPFKGRGLFTNTLITYRAPDQ